MSPLRSRACMSSSKTAVLSTRLPLKSMARLTGKVPTDSISQLEKVPRPNKVDFAVIRSHFRLDRGIEVIRIKASVRELAVWKEPIFNRYMLRL